MDDFDLRVSLEASRRRFEIMRKKREFEEALAQKMKDTEMDLKWDPVTRSMRDVSGEWRSTFEVRVEKLEKIIQGEIKARDNLTQRAQALEDRCENLENWFTTALKPSLRKLDLQEKIEAFSLLEDE